MNARWCIGAIALLSVGVQVGAQQPTKPGSGVHSGKMLPPLSVTDEDGQPEQLPPLPTGMTIAILREGDVVFHGRGGCVSCHGLDATGVPGRGSSLTSSLAYVPKPHGWSSLDSLERAGIPESITRSTVRCPARGVTGKLTDAEVSRVSAYVWALTHVRGEPWTGGHATHR